VAWASPYVTLTGLTVCPQARQTSFQAEVDRVMSQPAYDPEAD
jgi:hypothetical protein